MATYTVQPGDSFAKIARIRYGNERWLIELANANGGINRILHPGEVIEVPDFDTTQSPVITNEQWAGVPTGMTGNTVNYNNVPTPTIRTKPTSSTAAGTTSLPSKPRSKFNPAANGVPAEARAGGVGNYGQTNYGKYSNTAPAALPGGTGYSGAAWSNGVPDAARQTSTSVGGALSNRKQNPARMTKAPTPVPEPYRTTQAAYNAQNTATQNWFNGQGFNPNVNGVPPEARAGGVGNYGQVPAGNAYNAADGAPPPTPASDRSNIAWAARYTGLAIYEYGRTGNRSQLPTFVSARVAAELPFRGAGYDTIEEFMLALGYRVGPNGTWVRYDPQVTRAYTPQAYSAPAYSGGGGGYSRGPMAQFGYPNEGIGLTNWRISG